MSRLSFVDHEQDNNYYDRWLHWVNDTKRIVGTQLRQTLRRPPTGLVVFITLMAAALLIFFVERPPMTADGMSDPLLLLILKLLIDKAETLSILAGLVLYIKRLPTQKKQEHYQAFQVIDAAHEGPAASHARRMALEFLAEDGVDMRRVTIPGAILPDIILSNALMTDSDLSNTNFTDAHLENAWLSGAKLDSANLSNAHLQGADLREAEDGRAHV